MSALDRVVLAISAFRSDEAVLTLLEKAFAADAPRFGQVLVVDSLGSGRIADEVAARGWPVNYVNSDSNLGSAGNLDRRLQEASGTGLDWCLALNHDAALDPAKAMQLVAHGEAGQRVGAVYPRLRLTSANNQLDRPRRATRPFGGPIRGNRPSDDCQEVAWSSSNGALYHLDPIRAGLNCWPKLWMGYEDLAIGWELSARGWLQLLCDDVIIDDNYEYRRVRLLGRWLMIVDKPPWYSYYQLRNLALIRRGSDGQAIGLATIAARAFRDLGLTLLFRDRKLYRLRLLMNGLLAGLTGTSGKGPVP